jgi:hypothetical protein
MRWIATLAAAAMLAACQEGEPGPSIGSDGVIDPGPDAGAGRVIEPGIDDACGADDYAGLVGANIAAVTLPADLNARILGPDDAATMDFIPDRLNILTDEDGVILSLDCG